MAALKCLAHKEVIVFKCVLSFLPSWFCPSLSFSSSLSPVFLSLPSSFLRLTVSRCVFILSLSLCQFFSSSSSLSAFIFPSSFLFFYCCVSITSLSLSLTLLLSSFVFAADLSLCSLSLARGQSVTVMFGGEQRASDGWVGAGVLLQKQRISPLVRSIFLSSAAPGSGLHITVTEWPCRRSLIKG